MVLDKLSSGLKDTFRKIAGMSVVDKDAVEAIVRDVQRTLIMSDVDVGLVAELSDRIKKEVLGEKPPAGMSLRDYFVKILYDEIVSFLGEEKAEIGLKKQKILVVGLFGSGKTTTIGKLAKWFKTRGLNPGMVACDTHRPAAQEQLEQIAERIGAPVYKEGKNPESIAKNAVEKSREDVLIFDSAGRDALDRELADELKELGKIIKPDEVLLVIPADIGQAARKQASEFNSLVGITGIVVTKLDGTAKGGGALAAAHVSGAKVKFIGAGEKIDDLEVYDPKRFVSRLIGYGDIQGLLDRAKQAGVEVSEEKARKLLEGKFTMLDFQEQIKQMRKMGSMSKIMEMIPGASGLKIPKDLLDVQEDKMKKWQHMIDSMTKEEREDPDVIKHSRVSRIASGSGSSESDVRELLKYYKQVQKVMKLTKGGKGLKRGPLAQLAKQLGFGGI